MKVEYRGRTERESEIYIYVYVFICEFVSIELISGFLIRVCLFSFSISRNADLNLNLIESKNWDIAVVDCNLGSSFTFIFQLKTHKNIVWYDMIYMKTLSVFD